MKKLFSILSILLVISLSGCELLVPTTPPKQVDSVSGDLTVYFFDVGQADCSLVLLPDGKNMVIDAGNNSDGLLIADFLRNKGIETIDYLVLTHPHEDHLGGADVLINSFGLGEVYMPKIKDSLVPTTKTYEEVLDALVEKQVKVNAAQNGMKIIENNNLSVVCFSPFKEYSELNNYSIVVRLDYGETSFLLTGDAEAMNEKEMLNAGCDLDTDILKVGHHGSNYSTTTDFLRAVTPEYAVISVGEGNRYRHPDTKIVDRLYNYNTKTVYRTDLNGTVIAETDGKTYTLKTDKNIMLDGSR